MSKTTVPVLGYLRWLPEVNSGKAESMIQEERQAIEALARAQKRLEAAREAGTQYARAHWKRAEIDEAKKIEAFTIRYDNEDSE